jgi:hypothetical protein
MTTLRRIVFAMRMYICVTVKKIWHSTERPSLCEQACRFCHKNIYIIANKAWHSTWRVSLGERSHRVSHKKLIKRGAPPNGCDWTDATAARKNMFFNVACQMWTRLAPCCGALLY